MPCASHTMSERDVPSAVRSAQGCRIWRASFATRDSKPGSSLPISVIPCGTFPAPSDGVALGRTADRLGRAEDGPIPVVGLRQVTCPVHRRIVGQARVTRLGVLRQRLDETAVPDIFQDFPALGPHLLSDQLAQVALDTEPAGR